LLKEPDVFVLGVEPIAEHISSIKNIISISNISELIDRFAIAKVRWAIIVKLKNST
jgi:hypothetical protein